MRNYTKERQYNCDPCEYRSITSGPGTMEDWRGTDERLQILDLIFVDSVDIEPDLNVS